MENASKMRIICDPFKKEIEYQWYDFNIDDYVEFDSEYSKLTSEEFVNATIQNRAHEIVGLINQECNVGNVGLEIVFIGTEDDYYDFCDVINNYYSEANISCVRDEFYYNTASLVLPGIKDKFAEIRTMLEDYTEDEIAKCVDKYSDAVKPSISLCMMGLYSAGKSAFINSIIGAEVLPSASDPTTAKVCKIYCDKKYQIRFWFDEEECILTFEGSVYKPNSNCEKEIIRELQSITSADERHDEIFHMNRALGILNNYNKDNKHKLSDMIEIRIPFVRTTLPTEEFEFVIYDTPGSNSKNNVKHFEILKDSLDEQTNALPVFLTTPDTMDAEDNDKILKLIEGAGAVLDTTNAIVIVNKADEKGPKALSEKCNKCQKLRITQWKSTRVFFLSSVIAIASKKNNPDSDEEWIDGDMFGLYEEKEAKYSSDKMKLFEYNILDESKKQDIVDYSDSEKTTHLYKNSGLESIEKEIGEYARKYALYNKCQQASEYLQKAIDLCVENVIEVEADLSSELEKARTKFGLEKKILSCQLEKKKEDIGGYNSEFQQMIEKYYGDFIKQENLIDDPEAKRTFRNALQEQWKQFKIEEKQDETKKNKKWALSKIQMYAEEKCNYLLGSFSNNVNSQIVSFWDNKTKLFKKNCLKIVHDSDGLTDKQKEILKNIVLSTENMSNCRLEFDLRKVGAIRHKRFLFWERDGEKFDVKKCCAQLVKTFYDEVRKKIADTESENEKNFKKWTDSLINKLTEELCTFNAGLSSTEQKIGEIKKDIESKKKCEDMLKSSKNCIDALLSLQKRGEGNG